MQHKITILLTMLRTQTRASSNDSDKKICSERRPSTRLHKKPFPTTCKHLRAALSRRIHRHATHANTIRSASGTNLVPKPPRRFLFVAWGSAAWHCARTGKRPHWPICCRRAWDGLGVAGQFVCERQYMLFPKKIEALREREAMTTTTQNQWRQAQSTTQQKSENSNRKETE